jgi:hypothetical protein
MFELFKMRRGGILADEMGTGKTVQVNIFFLNRFHDNVLYYVGYSFSSRIIFFLSGYTCNNTNALDAYRPVEISFGKMDSQNNCNGLSWLA